MNTTPTPDNARQAVQDVDRGDQALAPAPKRWVWIVAGILTVACGMLVDRAPQLARGYGSSVVILLVVVALVVGNTRWGGRRTGTRVSRDPATTAWSMSVFALVVFGAGLATALHVPHVALAVGLVGGVLLAVVGPSWQRRVLARVAQE